MSIYMASHTEQKQDNVQVWVGFGEIINTK